MKDYRRANDHINKKINYRINKNYLRDNMFINGFDSDGIEITIYFNNEFKMVVPYSEKKELELFNIMINQMKDTIKYYHVYSDYIKKMQAKEIELWEEETDLNPRMMFLPIHHYNMNSQIRDVALKYSYYLKYCDLINAYAKQIFAEYGEPKGYIPSYITPNDVDGYSLKELIELVEGIKKEQLEKTKRLR